MVLVISLMVRYKPSRGIVLMQDLRSACEKSLYKELYHYTDAGKTDRYLVMDTVSGQICIRKVLSVYQIRVFQYLKDHHDPHIPAIHSFWEEDGSLTVIEECIKGRTLEYILENEHPDEYEKRRILTGICDGLIFLHSAEPPIIHRDLKLSNIMLTDDGIVKIIDYDAARIWSSDQNYDTELLGTPGSAAPEQYGFGQSDERTDIYALGILIRTLFPADRAMCRIAAKATRMDPSDRYPKVADIRKQLDHLQKSTRKHLLAPALTASAVCIAFLLFFIMTAASRQKSSMPAETAASEAGSAAETTAGTDGNPSESTYAIGQEFSEQASSMVAEAAAETASAEKAAFSNAADFDDAQKVQLTDSGYTVTYDDSFSNVYYAIRVSNPNAGYTVHIPVATITVRADDGTIITTNDQKLPSMTPGDTIYYASSISYEADTKVGSVDISVSNVKKAYEKGIAGAVPSSAVVLSNPKEQTGTYSNIYTGEVTNNSVTDFNLTAVVLIYRYKGEIVGGDRTFIDDLEAGGTKPFQLETYLRPDQYDSYELHAMKWFK